jgi:hypothetical protein
VAGGVPRLVDRDRTHLPVGVRNQVVPALGELRLREVTPGVVSRALRAISERQGPSAAKSTALLVDFLPVRSEGDEQRGTSGNRMDPHKRSASIEVIDDRERVSDRAGCAGTPG